MAIQPASLNPRRWVSFDDAQGDTWLFDLSFLLSNWTCVFGSTCRGVAENPEIGRLQGCCSHGVHLVDDEDQAVVAAAAARLTDYEWENRGLITQVDDVFALNDEGELLTAVVEDACIFLNGPDAPTGPGCALHFGANRAGETYPQWKPAACWQLPLRLEELTDTNGATTTMVRAWTRNDWGEGGADFDWWCTEDAERAAAAGTPPGAGAEAFIGSEPVYLTLRAELIELIGEEPYQWLWDYLAPTRELDGRHKPARAASSAEVWVNLGRSAAP